MKKPFYLLILLISLVYNSCTTKIDLEAISSEPQIVVNSLITKDSTITVNLSKTGTMINSEPEFVENAKIELQANNKFVEILSYTDSGNYVSEIIAAVGIEYRIIVEVSGFKTITASTEIPEPPVISSANIFPNSYYEQNESKTVSEAEISFNDPTQTSDYYHIGFYYFQYNRGDWDSTTNTQIIDSTIFAYGGIFYLNSHSPVILNEDDLRFYQGAGRIRNLVFSDELLSAENTVSFLVDIPTNEFYWANVVLRKISYDYYLFHKSWVRHQFNQGMGSVDATNMFLSSNPNDLYSNIDNGLGIFAGYSETHSELQEIQASK